VPGGSRPPGSRRSRQPSRSRAPLSDVLSETYKAALETDETAAIHAERMSAWAYQVARFRAIAIIRPRRSRLRTQRRLERERTSPAQRAGIARADRRAPWRRSRRHGFGHVRRRRRSAERRDARRGGPTRTRGAAQAASRSARRVAARPHRRAHDTRRSRAARHQQVDTQPALPARVGTPPSAMRGRTGRFLRPPRRLMASNAALAHELLGWRDAHIEGCVCCQVAAGRRMQILLPVMPVITLPASLSPLLDRVGSSFERTSGGRARRSRRA
jgi:hypothetical protein